MSFKPWPKYKCFSENISICKYIYFLSLKSSDSFIFDFDFKSKRTMNYAN